MAKILDYKNINGSTRFDYDFDKNVSTILGLYNEFKTDSSKLNFVSALDMFKVIDHENRKAIEITPNYILFSPGLNKEEIELYRKRIYKHIARKSKVYMTSSIDNMELSKASLLTDDLRSCASLLYYSLHKFTNSRLYYFLNNSINLEDSAIQIREVEHFTSKNFFKFIEKGTKVELLNQTNYVKKLCFDRRKKVNPFLLISYVFDEFFEDMNDELSKGYAFIRNKVLGDSFFREESYLALLENDIKSYYEKKKKNQTVSSQDEFLTAIKYCIVQYEKPEVGSTKKASWLIHLFALRLYWLRQTADYDFDFEVNTSSREVSILLASVEDMLKVSLEEEEIREKQKMEDAPQLLENQNSIISKKVVYKQNNDDLFYRVGSTFPEEIAFDRKNILMHMSSVHLDTSFSKELIFEVLNFTPYVTNKGKYFIYSTKNTISLNLFIYINKEGRWTVWFDNNSPLGLSELDLIENFKNFMEIFKRAFKDLNNIEIKMNLVSSYPVYEEGTNNTTLCANSIPLFYSSFEQRNTIILKKLIQKVYSEIKTLDNKVKMYPGEKSLYFEDLILDFSIIPASKNSSKMTRDSAVVDALLINVDDDELDEIIPQAFFSIIIEKENENIMEDDFPDFLESYFSNLVDELNKSDHLLAYEIAVLTPEELEEFLNKEDHNIPIFFALGSIFNQVAFNFIDKEKFEASMKFLEIAREVNPSGSYQLATTGLWYLRNPDISIDLAEKEGCFYYEQAIKLERESSSENVLRFEQKYFLELARFYSKHNLLHEALLNIDKSIKIGDKSIYFEEALSLKEVLEAIIKRVSEPASDLEVTTQVESEHYNRFDSISENGGQEPVINLENQNFEEEIPEENNNGYNIQENHGEENN